MGTFLAASILNMILGAALAIHIQWGALSWAIEWLPFLRKPDAALIPVFGVGILQLAWWLFIILCYILGKEEQVAEKYEALEWMRGFRFRIFPFAFAICSAAVLSIFFWIARAVDWIWHLFF